LRCYALVRAALESSARATLDARRILLLIKCLRIDRLTDSLEVSQNDTR